MSVKESGKTQTAPIRRPELPTSGPARTGATLSFAPAVPIPGREATIAIDVAGKDGAPVTDFADLHTKPMHLIAVSEDLSDFRHVHPKPLGGSRFEAKLDFGIPSNYRLWTEYQPKNARTSTIDVADVATKGASPTMVALAVDFAQPKTVGQTRASLKGADKLLANQPATLTIDIADKSTGRPAKLEPLLGADGHAIVVSSNRSVFQHLHGMQAGGAPAAGGHDMHGMPGMAAPARPAGASTLVSFETKFPAAGVYRIFAQVQRDGQVVTIPFTVAVKE